MELGERISRVQKDVVEQQRQLRENALVLFIYAG